MIGRIEAVLHVSCESDDLFQRHVENTHTGDCAICAGGQDRYAGNRKPKILALATRARSVPLPDAQT